MTSLAKATHSVRDYFVGAYHEFRRVTWPTREQVVQYTVLVTVTIILVTAFLTAVDYGMEQVVSRYLIH